MVNKIFISEILLWSTLPWLGSQLHITISTISNHPIHQSHRTSTAKSAHQPVYLSLSFFSFLFNPAPPSSHHNYTSANSFNSPKTTFPTAHTLSHPKSQIQNRKPAIKPPPCLPLCNSNSAIYPQWHHHQLSYHGFFSITQPTAHHKLTHNPKPPCPTKSTHHNPIHHKPNQIIIITTVHHFCTIPIPHHGLKPLTKNPFKITARAHTRDKPHQSPHPPSPSHGRASASKAIKCPAHTDQSSAVAKPTSRRRASQTGAIVAATQPVPSCCAHCSRKLLKAAVAAAILSPGAQHCIDPHHLTSLLPFVAAAITNSLHLHSSPSLCWEETKNEWMNKRVK